MTNFVELTCGTHLIKFMHNVESIDAPACPFCQHVEEHHKEETPSYEMEVYCEECGEFFWIKETAYEEERTCKTFHQLGITGQIRKAK